MYLPHLLAVIFLLLAGCQGGVEQQLAPRPNILFIMSDDHAINAVSSYGSQLIETPNIDRIADEGIRFANSFVTNSICAPSRAVILSGKYSHLNGLRSNQDVFDSSQVTFPKLLRKAGYETMVVGKWHLKDPPAGFDYWQILTGQGWYYNPRMLKMGDTIRHVGYTTEVITDVALGALENRDTSKPFCMLLHHKAPHRNWMPDTKHLHLFNEQEIPEPPTLFDDYATRTSAAREQDMEIKNMWLSHDLKLTPESFDSDPATGGSKGFDATTAYLNQLEHMTPEQRAAWDVHYDKVNAQFKQANLSGEDLLRWKYRRYLQDYLRCVVSVDENIGRVLDYLDAKGLAENTIVIYTSDQGFYLGEHGWYDKRFMYEESLRMPLVMRFPKVIPSKQLEERMVLNLDFAPTFLDFAGVEIPDAMQGESLSPLCRSEKPDWRNSMYYHYYQDGAWHYVKKHYGIRTERYKLIHFYDVDEWEFYDLEKDPHELENGYVQIDNKEIVHQLKDELQNLRAYYGVVE